MEGKVCGTAVTKKSKTKNTPKLECKENREGQSNWS